MKTLTKYSRGARLLVAGAVLALSSSAMAAGKQTLCVWDILGSQGDVFNLMKDYKLAAAKWGANIDLRPYTDEKIASEDFKAGQCDAVVMTGLRGRQFNSFTGSIDSMGSLPTYPMLQKALATIASPAAAKLMVSGSYEVAGLTPMGAAYLFVKDREINTIGKLSGKKIAVLDYDKAQAKMVQQVGAQPVASDVTNFAGKFNNGSVDIIGCPAAGFKPLELHKGLGTRGAIVNFPLLQLTLQIIIRHEKFPEGFGQKSREYVLSQYPRAMSLITGAEAEIDKKYWMQIPTADKDKYMSMLRESRIALTNDGTYDKRMMSVLRKVRCQVEPSNAECAQKLE